MQIPIDECKRLIEGRLGCDATYTYTSSVREARGDFLIDVKVHVFALTGHPESTEAYACPPGPIGSLQRGMVLVLRRGAIDSPVAAMRSVLGLT